MLFKEVFKLQYEVFKILVKWLKSDLGKEKYRQTPFYHWRHNRRRSSMDTKTAVACGVLYLFGQGTLTEKAALLRVPRPTFTRMANMIVDELVLRTGEVIRIPDMNKQVFLKCRRTGKPFPGAVFALDGTMCKLKVKGRRNDFYCRKGFACLNVQVMCDWNMNLVHVDSNFSGRTQDNDMFESSGLPALLNGPHSLLRPGCFVVADEGYATCGRVMRPYDRHSNEIDKKLFNLLFKSTRLIVENAIGAWKQKCPLLNEGLHKMNPEELAEAIQASAVLYQFCKTAEEELVGSEDTAYLSQTFTVPDAFLNKETPELRDYLLDYFVYHYPRTYNTLCVMQNNPGVNLRSSYLCLTNQSGSSNT